MAKRLPSSVKEYIFKIVAQLENDKHFQTYYDKEVTSTSFKVNFKEPFEDFYFELQYLDENLYCEYFTHQKIENVISANLAEISTFFNHFFSYAAREISSENLFSDLQKKYPSKNISNETNNAKSYPLEPVSDAYINEINIENFYSLKNIKLTDLAEKKEVYILGENGDGKTLLLQALVIASQWKRILAEQNFGETGKITELVFKSGMTFSLIDSQKNTYQKKDESSHKYLSNLFAYGFNRRSDSNGENIDKNYGFLSLFSDVSLLHHPVNFLKEIDRLESKQKNDGVDLETMKAMMKDILSDEKGNANIEINTEGKEIIFKERGTELEFSKLSEGYKSVMTWLMDVLYHFSRNQPNVKSTQDFVGTMIIDEVNLHLHPKWEYKIIGKLRHWFPKVQFIFTTHSPIIVLGASEDAVFYKLYKKKGETKIIAYNELLLGNMRIDQVLTSDFFGLAYARPRYLQNFMELREQILKKTSFSQEDEQKIDELEKKFGVLPTGETKLELKTQLLLNKILQKIEGNDKN